MITRILFHSLWIRSREKYIKYIAQWVGLGQILALKWCWGYGCNELIVGYYKTGLTSRFFFWLLHFDCILLFSSYKYLPLSQRLCWLKHWWQMSHSVTATSLQVPLKKTWFSSFLEMELTHFRISIAPCHHTLGIWSTSVYFFTVPLKVLWNPFYYTWGKISSC